MSDDRVIYCGSPGDEYVVSLRCPDCGPREMDVVQWDRREGVIRVRCPGCGSELFTNGTIPASRMRKKEVSEEWTNQAAQKFPTDGTGDDDGE